MRYRNLIIGSILGAIIGATLGFAIGIVSDGGQSGREPTTTSTILTSTIFNAIFFALVGGFFGAQVGAIDGTDLNLALDSRPIWPGDSIDVQVSLCPTKRFHVRRGQVRLVCLETYYENIYEGVSEKSSELYLLELPFLGREHVLKGLSYSESFKFLIPDDASPSLHSDEEPGADISWRVEAALDIVGRLDIRQARTVTVLPLMPDHAPPAIEDKVVFDECVACLPLSSTRVPAGGTVDGKFSIQMRQDLRVHGIRVERECWVRAGVKDKRTVKDVVSLKGETWLSGDLLTANQVQEWPIRLQVPKNAFPSMETDHTQVVWRVKGILDRGIRRNLVVQQQIQVFIDPADS